MTLFAVGFLTCVIGLVVPFGDPDNRLHQLALEDGIWAWVAIVTFYIGAPIADDFLQTRKARIA